MGGREVALSFVFIKVFGTHLEGRTPVTLFREQDFNPSTTVYQMCDPVKRPKHF